MCFIIVKSTQNFICYLKNVTFGWIQKVQFYSRTWIFLVYMALHILLPNYILTQLILVWCLVGFNSPPVITCPDPVVVTSLANNVGNTAAWNPPTCVDAEDGTITTSVCVPASGSFFPGVGVNTVTCTCTDSGGLSDECTFPVTVQGNNLNLVRMLTQNKYCFNFPI